MLYVFKSRASADLIMLEANGRRLLQILGKELTPKGIITPEQMADAIRALQAAILDEEQAQRGASAQTNDAPGAVERITLRQRLLPMIDMMGRCAKAGKEITWGV